MRWDGFESGVKISKRDPGRLFIETPDNSVPRTSATRVSPFAMEQAAKAKGSEPETEDHGGYIANSLVCVPERQVTQRAGVSTGGVIYS